MLRQIGVRINWSIDVLNSMNINVEVDCKMNTTTKTIITTFEDVLKGSHFAIGKICI